MATHLHRWVEGLMAYNGIQPHRDFAFQMPADGVGSKQEWDVCASPGWPEVVMPTALRMGTEGLQGVGAAVHEEFFVILGDLPCRFGVRCPQLRTSFRRGLLPAIDFPRLFGHGFHARVWVDNLKYFFCQTAASGGFPGDNSHGKPVHQSPGRSTRSRKLQPFISISSWAMLYPPNCSSSKSTEYQVPFLRSKT